MIIFSEKLEDILSNKKLGSSELVLKLNEFFITVHHDYLFMEKSILLLKKELNHFSAVKNYLEQLKSVISSRDKYRIKKFLEDYSNSEYEKYERIFIKLNRQLPSVKQIITLSRSGTLLNILRLWHNRIENLSVIICESRPKFEGRFLANDLLKSGLKVELIADSVMNCYVPEIDAAIIGADTVLRNGNVINKTGSKALALFCREYNKPFYVVTTRAKYSKLKNIDLKEEDPAEIWKRKHKNLKVSNIYFEEIEKELITEIISD